MQKVFSLLALATLMIVGCSKGQKDERNELLTGTWKWEESVPVVSLQNIAAATMRPGPGEVYLLDFKTNHTFSYTFNYAILKSGTYAIRLEGGGEKLRLSSSPESYYIDLDADTLILVSDTPGAGYDKYSRYK